MKKSKWQNQELLPSSKRNRSRNEDTEDPIFRVSCNGNQGVAIPCTVLYGREQKLLYDTTFNYSGQWLMRDTGNAGIAFLRLQWFKHRLRHRYGAQPAPAFEPIPRSPACLGLRGAAFYLTQRPHLPPSNIPAVYPLFPSLISLLFKDQIDYSHSFPYYSSLFDFYLPSSTWHRASFN